MKIAHVCLAAFYCEGYSYQENLLPLYHKKMGYEVDIIASLQSFDEYGRPCLLEGPEDYVNANGIHVVRLDYRKPKALYRIIRKYIGLAEELERSAPDILFVHGVQCGENPTFVEYVRRHPGTRMFMDSHADYSNSATNWFSKWLLHRIVWRHYARVAEPYVERFWGVLPARVDFLIENYGLPREKCDLLVMGADDDEVARASNPSVRKATRDRLGFSSDDFVVVTGGKIDPAKTQTFLLMDAVRAMGEGTKLLVFGPVDPVMQDDFNSRMDEEQIVYVPWADSSESYDYFAAADVICFPGRHSVYWEQAAAMGKPLIIKRWPGTDHVDICGNAIFLEKDSIDEIHDAIARVLLEKGDASGMQCRAHDAAGSFLYSDIARRSIGLARKI